MDDLPPAPDVAGTSLDGTKTFTITAEENAALCRSTGVEPAADGSAHPIYYYIATQVAMGKTVAGVCETCEFDVDDGPMMGSSGVKFSGQLMVGESYKVTGEILSLVRKKSRKLGVMDVLTYRLRLHPAAGGDADHGGRRRSDGRAVPELRAGDADRRAVHLHRAGAAVQGFRAARHHPRRTGAARAACATAGRDRLPQPDGTRRGWRCRACSTWSSSHCCTCCIPSRRRGSPRSRSRWT